MKYDIPFPQMFFGREQSLPKITESTVALLVAVVYFAAGIDVLAISLPFGQFKFSNGIFLCVYFLLNKHIYYTKTELLCATGVIFTCLLSSLFSYDMSRSFAYTLLLTFNIFLVASIGRALFSLSADGVKSGLVLCARLQILLGICLAALGLQDRVSILFYEPAYWAIALTPYLYLTAKKHIFSSWFDWVLIFLVLFITKSANLMLLVLAAIALSQLSSWSIKSFLRMALFLGIMIFVLWCYSKVSNDLVAITVRRIFESEDVLQQCLGRGGNRYPRMLAALDVFQNNLGHGVGPGAFFTFDKTEAIQNSYPSGFAYYDIGNSPAINIFFEVGAEGGVLFLLAFVTYLVCGLAGKKSDTTLRGIVLLMIFGLLFESSIQRSYFWLVVGAASFLSGGCPMPDDSLGEDRSVPC